MIIYIVAAERNMGPGSVNDSGGLWANVGQTERTVNERLNDEDYRRKAAGGKWKIIEEYQVQNSFSDHVVHKYLKNHSRVKWSASKNTEEFLFFDDTGDGAKAVEIVGEFIERHSLPHVQAELVEFKANYVTLLQLHENLLQEYKNLKETDESKLKIDLLQQLEATEEMQKSLDENYYALDLEYSNKFEELEHKHEARKTLLVEKATEEMQKSLDENYYILDEEYSNKLEELESRKTLLVEKAAEVRESNEANFNELQGWSKRLKLKEVLLNTREKNEATLFQKLQKFNAAFTCLFLLIMFAVGWVIKAQEKEVVYKDKIVYKETKEYKKPQPNPEVSSDEVEPQPNPEVRGGELGEVYYWNDSKKQCDRANLWNSVYKSSAWYCDDTSASISSTYNTLVVICKGLESKGKTGTVLFSTHRDDNINAFYLKKLVDHSSVLNHWTKETRYYFWTSEADCMVSGPSKRASRLKTYQ